MKKINDFELQTIMGGWANPEGCKKVQEMVPQMEKDPDADWEGWLDAFDRECLGIWFFLRQAHSSLMKEECANFIGIGF